MKKSNEAKLDFFLEVVFIYLLGPAYLYSYHLLTRLLCKWSIIDNYFIIDEVEKLSLFYLTYVTTGLILLAFCYTAAFLYFRK